MNLSLVKCLCFLTQAYEILAYGCITMRQHVVYILDLSMTLTLTYMWGGGSLVSFTHSFYLVSTYCTVTSNVLTVTNENHKQCIFPILTVNVLWSLMCVHHLIFWLKSVCCLGYQYQLWLLTFTFSSSPDPFSNQCIFG